MEPTKVRNYKKEENSMLEEWVSEGRSYHYMAKKLNRTVKSVSRRIERLGIEDKHLMTGTFSAYELARITGYSPKTVGRWIIQQGLPAEKKAVKGEVKACTAYYITAQDFWKWAETRKDSIHFSDIEKQTLLPEPDWLDTELRKEYYKSKRKRFWTPEDDEKIWNMYYAKGIFQKDIAKEMKTSKSSIEHRIARIRKERGVTHGSKL